ncbi:MAG TPA: hypothetical protein VFW65_38805 [Pseudonocardiaceae bacterium]|nr:hypothetical protein [Pseudonocardiaceae bacterium]
MDEPDQEVQGAGYAFMFQGMKSVGISVRADDAGITAAGDSHEVVLACSETAARELRRQLTAGLNKLRLARQDHHR